MTLSEAQNILFSWFDQHDLINLSADLDKLVDTSNTEDKELLKTIFKKALLALEKLNIVSSLSNADYDFSDYGDIFILVKPLSQYGQTIEISGYTALEISEIINKYCHLTKNKDNICSAISIQEKDIIFLLGIVNFLEQNINLDTLDKK